MSFSSISGNNLLMRLPEIAAQSLASLLTCSYYAQYLFKISTNILFAKAKF
jgi:hypothetical protein